MSGQIIEIAGLPSSGKSLLAASLITEGIELPLWIDADHALPASVFKRILVVVPSSAEEAFEIIAQINNKDHIAIIDSLPALKPKTVIEGRSDIVLPHLTAQFLHWYKENGTGTLIIVNQVRSLPKAFGATTKSFAYKVMERFCDERWLIIKKTKTKAGQRITLRLLKSADRPPGTEITIEL